MVSVQLRSLLTTLFWIPPIKNLYSITFPFVFLCTNGENWPWKAVVKDRLVQGWDTVLLRESFHLLFFQSHLCLFIFICYSSAVHSRTVSPLFRIHEGRYTLLSLLIPHAN